MQEQLTSNSLISNCLAGNYNSDSSLVLGSFFCNQTLLYFVGTPIAYLVICTVKPVWFVTCTMTKTGLQHTLQGRTIQKKAKERICSRNVHIGKALYFVMLCRHLLVKNLVGTRKLEMLKILSSIL